MDDDRVWPFKDLDLEKLRDLVIGYDKRVSGTEVLALKRISDAVRAEAEENKDWVRFMHMSPDEYPLPILSGEEGKVGLMSHVIDLIDVIEGDFGMVKRLLAKVDPKTAPVGDINARFFVSRSTSRMLQRIDVLVLEELRLQKVEDVGLMIYMAMSRTVNKRMVGVMVGLLKNPDPVESIEKLKRLQQCLRDVIAVGKEFISTHGFVPQPNKSFPVAQHGSHTSLVLQHVTEVEGLIDQVFYYMDLLRDCAFHKLKMKELEQVEEVVMKMSSALEKSAVAEGGVYLDALEE